MLAIKLYYHLFQLLQTISLTAAQNQKKQVLECPLDMRKLIPQQELLWVDPQSRARQHGLAWGMTHLTWASKEAHFPAWQIWSCCWSHHWVLWRQERCSWGNVPSTVLTGHTYSLSLFMLSFLLVLSGSMTALGHITEARTSHRITQIIGSEGGSILNKLCMTTGNLCSVPLAGLCSFQASPTMCKQQAFSHRLVFSWPLPSLSAYNLIAQSDLLMDLNYSFMCAIWSLPGKTWTYSKLQILACLVDRCHPCWKDLQLNISNGFLSAPLSSPHFCIHAPSPMF